MIKEFIYDPWAIDIGGALISAIIIWAVRSFFLRLKRKKQSKGIFTNSKNKENTMIEFVRPLILLIDEESRNNINFKKLSIIVKAIYKENGYEACVSSFSRVTGCLEIKNGSRKEVVTQLIDKLKIEFNIKAIEIVG